MVPFNRSIKEVLICVPPFDCSKHALSPCSSPREPGVFYRDQTVFLLRLDHLPDDELWPHLHLCSACLDGFFDLLGKSSQNGLRIGRPSVHTNQEVTGSTSASAYHLQEAIGQNTIP